MPGKKSWDGGGLALLLASSLCVLTSACLDRPLCTTDCEPKTTNQFVIKVPTGGIDKIDLLFVIDNSASMADKQAILRQAVPSLLARFVNPLCVENGAPLGPSSNGKCERGVSEFKPIDDIHIAIITSSLGSVSGKYDCGQSVDANPNDRAWLLPLARPSAGLDSWNQSGFLAWDPLGTKNQPPGTREASSLTSAFQNQVRAVGERGCGFEATLESWYRFLVAADPPAKVTTTDGNTVAEGVDTELLKQRAAFLRPDSLVAVVMLTDENDCSVVPAGPASLMDMPAGNWRSTTACAQNPNDPCCRSCGTLEDAPPAGCAPVAADPECKINEGKTAACVQNASSPCCRSCSAQETSPPTGCEPLATDSACLISKGKHGAISDQKNVRCWDQKRRFGIDLLEPTSKYVRGLTKPTIVDRSGREQPNPLFTARNGRTRAPDLVYLAGIVGVPWQDIATPESLTGPDLRYMTAKELAAGDRWDVILGDPATRRLPTDPHMIESTVPRSGSHPFLPNAAIAPADAAVPPTRDVISGHEQAPPDRDDLQYACIFELETPVNCTESFCDCALSTNPEGEKNKKRPLCQPPGGGAFGTTQHYAKAYPGTRHLEVLKGIGGQAIVASICPKVVRSARPDADPNFGYNPAMAALVDRIGPALANQCLGRAPALEKDGSTSCVILEVDPAGGCDCTGAGRRAPDADVMETVRGELRDSRTCGDEVGQTSCNQVCACQISETTGDALNRCRGGAAAATEQAGYCYVDPDKGLGSPDLVRDCPSTQRRLLRFVGADTPKKGSLAYMACMGSTVQR